MNFIKIIVDKNIVSVSAARTR